MRNKAEWARERRAAKRAELAAKAGGKPTEPAGEAEAKEPKPKATKSKAKKSTKKRSDD